MKVPELLGSWINVLGNRLGDVDDDPNPIPTLPDQGALTIGATADLILLADGNGIAYATKPA